MSLVQPDREKHEHTESSCACSSAAYDSMAIAFARTSARFPHSQLWRTILDSCEVMDKGFRDILECDLDKIPAQYKDLATDLLSVLNNAGINHDLERFRCLSASRLGSSIMQLLMEYFRSFSDRSHSVTRVDLEWYVRLPLVAFH